MKIWTASGRTFPFRHIFYDAGWTWNKEEKWWWIPEKDAEADPEKINWLEGEDFVTLKLVDTDKIPTMEDDLDPGIFM